MLVSLQSHLKKHDRLGGLHFGTVVDNADPERLGCVRVRVPGVIDGDDDALPWAYPIYPPGGGSAAEQGFHVPRNGSSTAVQFGDSSDPYSIFYLGWVPSGPTRSALAGEDDYPNVYGSVDNQSTGVRVNKNDRSTTFTHASGVAMNVDTDGNVAITIPGNLSIQAQGGVRLISGDEIDISAMLRLGLASVAGDMDVAVAGDLTQLVTGGVTIDAVQALSLTGAGTVDINAGTAMAINAQLAVIIKSLLQLQLEAAAAVDVRAGAAATIRAGAALGMQAGGAANIQGSIVSVNGSAIRLN